MSRIAATLRFLASSAIVGGFVWLGMETIEQAPRGWRLEAARITPTSSPVALGWQELGQTQGASLPNTSRLMAMRKNDGWWITNGSRERSVVLGLPNGVRRDIAAVPLHAGDVLDVAGTVIKITEAGPRNVALQTSDGRQVRWSEAKAGLDFVADPALPSCSLDNSVVSEPNRQWLRRIMVAAAKVFGRDAGSERIFFVGGGANCPERWATPTLPPRAVSIFAATDGILVRVEAGIDGQLRPADGGPPVDLAQPWISIGKERVARLSVGGVRYGLSEDGADLILRPEKNRGLFEHPAPDQPGISLEWQAMEEGSWLGGGLGIDALIARNPMIPAMVVAGATMGAGCAALAWLRAWHRRRLDGAGAMAVYGGGLGAVMISLSILLGQEGLDLRAPLSLAAVTWLWATAILALTKSLRGSFGVLWITMTILVGAGTISHLTLASGMPSEHFVDAPRKVAFVWTLIAMTTASAAMLTRARVTEIVVAVLGVRMTNGTLTAVMGKVLRWGAPCTVITGLGIEAVMGWEAGLGVAQPSELAKAVYMLGLSMVGAWHLHYSRLNHAGVQWGAVMLRLIGGIGLVCLGIIVGLKAADDNSPILILGLITIVWLVVVARAIRRAVGGRRYASRWMALPLGLAAFALLAGLAVVGWGTLGNPCEVEDNKICRRIQINGDPLGHPDGYQISTALGIAANAPLGPENLFQPNALSVRLLPEVESDMVVSYLLNRFGRVAMAALAAVQVAYLLALVAIARRSLRVSGPFESRLASSFLGFAVGCFASAQALQWGLGYANALALAPIMGQPFTFFSLGNSHILAIVTPTLVLALIAARMEMTKKLVVLKQLNPN